MVVLIGLIVWHLSIPVVDFCSNSRVTVVITRVGILILATPR